MSVARRASFSAAAQDLGVSAAYVTKRVRVLEEMLTTKLFHRTSRRVVVTEQGERVFEWAQRVLDDIDNLVQEVSASKRTPRGVLKISSSFGFGRLVVAPAVARLVESLPTLGVRLDVLDRLIDVAGEGFDLDIRVGDEIAPQMIARRLASNHRVLCAAPEYLARRGTPRSLSDLATHDCVVIKERDHPFGVWRLKNGAAEETVKVMGSLSTNDGSIAVDWAVAGRGIVLRSFWDVGALIAAGKLAHILPGYRQEANVWAVYPDRLKNSAKVRVCVEFLEADFGRWAL